MGHFRHGYVDRAAREHCGGKSIGIITAPSTLSQSEKDFPPASAYYIIPLQFGSNYQGQRSWPLAETYGLTLPKTLVDVVQAPARPCHRRLSPSKALAQWQGAGYLTANSASYSSSQVYSNFLAGKGLFVLSGTWNEPLPGTSASTAKFALIPFPLGKASQIGAVASGDFPWSIPTKSAQPRLAAACIDYITSPAANATWIANGQAPASTSSMRYGRGRLALQRDIR